MKWIQVCESEVDFRLSTTTFHAISESTRFRNHAHFFIEWGMVLSGACIWEIEGEEYYVEENSIMLLPPQCLHMEKIPEGEKARLAWIGFVLPVPVEGLRPYVLHTGRWAVELKRLFVSLFEEQSETGYGKERRMQLCLQEILLLAARAIHEQQERTQEGVGRKSNIPLRQIQLAHAIAQYFENNLSVMIRMEEVARYFQLSPQHLSVLFHRVYGMTPIEYLQRVRHRYACYWLGESDKAIKEVAIDCGYPDNAYFSRQFSKRQGCSPTQYRLRRSQSNFHA
jgi:AraC-like DNA-binding protein